MASPVLQESKIILVTSIIRRRLQWILVLLQRITYDPRSCGLVLRRILGRGMWGALRMDDSRAGKALSETGVARSYLDEER